MKRKLPTLTADQRKLLSSYLADPSIETARAFLIAGGEHSIFADTQAGLAMLNIKMYSMSPGDALAGSIACAVKSVARDMDMVRRLETRYPGWKLDYGKCADAPAVAIDACKYL